MPFFYGWNEKHEWRALCVALVAAMVLVNLVLTMQPAFNAARANGIRELKIRADLIARQIRDRNVAALQQRAETRADIGTLDRERGVRVALLTDLDGRIIAPASRVNQYFVNGRESLYAKTAANNYRSGREFAFYDHGRGANAIELPEDVVMAVEPLKIYNPATGQDTTVAIAVASIDGRYSLPDGGTIGVAYSNAMIACGIVTALVLMVLYRLTLKPLSVLHDDLDQALKGELTQVSRKQQFGELASLFDSIDVAVQRASSAESSFGGGMATITSSALAAECVPGLRAVAAMAGAGLLALDSDQRIVHLNPKFEEISGIHADAAIGSDVATVARDQAFVALCSDFFERVQCGGEVLTESFEFSGVP
jgi:PAS domain-containing protein